jgi:hypothetical protein
MIGTETMTRYKLISLCATLLFLAAAPRAQATSIELLPSADLLTEGDLVEILVFGIDFPDGTDGGDFSIDWSPNLEFVGLTIQDPPWDLSSFDASNASQGYIDYVDVFSLFETPGIGGVEFGIATLTLQAADPGAAFVSLSEGSVGWSLEGNYIEVSGYVAELDIVAVPEPSTAALVWLSLWLLGRVGQRAR